MSTCKTFIRLALAKSRVLAMTQIEMPKGVLIYNVDAFSRTVSLIIWKRQEQHEKEVVSGL